MKIYTRNKKAYHNYEIIETFETGIVLVGSEVKSVKDSKCSLEEGYVIIKDNAVVLKQVHIEHYKFCSLYSIKIDDTRDRILLLNKAEIKKLKKATEIKGYTIIPLKVYYNDNNKIKVEIGLAKGKKNYDKRQVLKDKQLKMDQVRELKKR